MLMRHPHPELQFTQFLPYGAMIHDGGVQFSVFSRSATGMRLLLYTRVEDAEPAEVIEFNPSTDRWGDVWSMFVPGIGDATLYHFQADGPRDPAHGHWFDGTARLIDPFSKALAGEFQPTPDGIIRPPKSVVVDDHFDWEGDRHLRRDLSETIIYEMHVGGFTRSSTSGVEHPGTYLGVIEKIPYLKALGVTAVELMPVHEFPIRGFQGQVLKRPNYWGYDPLAFFAPHRGYAVGSEPGAQVREFKQLIKALHRAGIEVILDVVFNHTCEGNERGPVLSFKGLENRVYYLLGNGGSTYSNYSGCGNTINGNHPIVREMIFYCLRYWVHNFHIDGFRFDLASILNRDRSGDLIPNAPIVEAIAEDPMLADTKIIAEAWDAAGAYQVGSFGGSRWHDTKEDRRWAEWNGRYRDDMRQFWRGDFGTLGAFAMRLSGSSDLYQDAGRTPYNSINFITSHDGFTLNDLVSYRDKHNEANGERNRDGDNNSCSANYGVEGPTDDVVLSALRSRQVKNMLATLMLSHGVPMIVSGDESRRTQRGNNNAYCQNNEISWFDWSLVEKNAGFVRFFQGLTRFRRSQPTVRRKHFLSGKPHFEDGLPDVSWFNALGVAVDWSGNDMALICLLMPPHGASCDTDGNCGREILLLVNATSNAREFILPAVAKGLRWRLFIDTAAESPLDIYPDLDGPPPVTGALALPDRSLRCYVAEGAPNVTKVK
ncbi:MAG: glycogen debranching protein GlgX [Planctomycetota bacterium]|nr:glycogen debranching protein GlgX [Planctomycetota bacterium]